MHSALRLGMLSLRTKPISYRILPISLFFVLHMHPSPPCTLSMQVKHTADASHASQLYWVHDGPLLAYLGVAPDRGTFAPTVIRREAMLKEVTAISHEPGTWVGGWVGGWGYLRFCLCVVVFGAGVRACVRARYIWRFSYVSQVLKGNLHELNIIVSCCLLLGAHAFVAHM